MNPIRAVEVAAAKAFQELIKNWPVNVVVGPRIIAKHYYRLLSMAVKRQDYQRSKKKKKR